MSEHNESTLPKWAQKRLSDLRKELACEKRSHEHTRKMHFLTEDGRRWFTLNPPVDKGEWCLYTAVGGRIVHLSTLFNTAKVFVSYKEGGDT